jgi:hypothetical protein
MFQNIFRHQIRINGYINIADAAYRRWSRRMDREINEQSWIRNDWFLNDFWDLQILFGERIYEEERWE